MASMAPIPSFFLFFNLCQHSICSFIRPLPFSPCQIQIGLLEATPMSDAMAKIVSPQATTSSPAQTSEQAKKLAQKISPSGSPFIPCVLTKVKETATHSSELLRRHLQLLSATIVSVHFSAQRRRSNQEIRFWQFRHLQFRLFINYL